MTPVKQLINLDSICPINIPACEDLWNNTINVKGTHSSESAVWQECKKNLELINDTEYPATLRTYFFMVKIPYFIGEYVIKNSK